jgi:hypothetical protein
MLDAGLSGAELAARCGWHESKTSRLVHAKAQPTDADIRAWCTACGAEDQADDLIAVARAVDSMYMEWRRRHRGGLHRTQQSSIDVYARTSHMRVYASNVIPGFLQTPEYATGLLRTITAFKHYPDDVAEAVAARVARSRFLYEGGHTYAVVLEEQVLRHRFGDEQAMAGQLQHLLSVLPLPSVALGIIPFGAPRTVWPLEAFYAFDDSRVAVETLTAEISVVQPREIADYARAFSKLATMAVYGDDARSVIREALTALG